MIGELTNHLWQSTVFAVVAGLLTVAFRKNRAQVRYGLWLSASLKFFVPFSLLMSLGSQLEWAPAADSFAAQIATPSISYTMEQITQPFPTVFPSPSSSRTESSTAHWVPLILFCLWACGFGAMVLVRLQVWRRIRAAAHGSTPLEIPAVGTQTRVQVRSCPGLLEPGVVGFRRPILLLPAGIVNHLEPRQLEAVLAHELCHVRRRDNLTGALHMIVEAVFWFHPLVWWIGARLVEERERACDEEVLRLGNEPQVYAEGILNVCKFYQESPLVCVSGIAGANLRKRIEDIMRNRIVHKLSLSRATLLAAAAVIAFAGPIAIGIVKAAASEAQSQIVIQSIEPQVAPVPFQAARAAEPSPQPAAQAPQRQASPPPARETFEVASIRSKPSVDGGRGAGPVGTACLSPAPIQIDPRRISISGVSLNQLIVMAYPEWADARGGCVGVTSANLLSGGPGWVRSDLWDIQATIPEGPVDYTVTTAPGPRGRGPISTVRDIGPRVRRMLQSLLADRFSLVLRSDSKDMPVYLLTIGSGFKSNGNPAWAMINGKPAVLNGEEMGAVKTRTIRRITEPDGKQYLSVGIWKMSMPEIAASLFDTTQRPVLDRTNLTGTFDFHLDYDTTGGGARPSIFTAIEEVGLKLEAGRAPLEVWTIERVARPSEN